MKPRGKKHKLETKTCHSNTETQGDGRTRDIVPRIENKRTRFLLHCNIRCIQSFRSCTVTFWNFSDYPTLGTGGKLGQSYFAAWPFSLARVRLSI